MIVNSSGVMQVAYINYNPVREIEHLIQVMHTGIVKESNKGWQGKPEFSTYGKLLPLQELDG